MKKDQLLVALIGHINYLLTTGVRHIKIQLNGIQYNLCKKIYFISNFWKMQRHCKIRFSIRFYVMFLKFSIQTRTKDELVS